MPVAESEKKIDGYQPKERWHPSIVAMADFMQEKITRNSTKGGWPQDESGGRTWMPPACDMHFLMGKLDEESKELREAVRILRDDSNLGKPGDVIENSRRNVRLEAADVANIAMMIADNASSDKESSDVIPKQ